jgi:hypothetical protein
VCAFRTASQLKGEELFYTVHVHGARPRCGGICINPGKIFDLTLPLDRVAEGYRAMDERRPIKPSCVHEALCTSS